MNKIISSTLLSIAFLAASAASASAATYYVATNGNDANPGTEAAPYRTFAKALHPANPNRPKAGDTLIVKDGVYTEALNTESTTQDKRVYLPSGTAGSPVTIKAQNRRGAVIRPVGGSSMLSVGNISTPVRYLVIDGLVFDGAQMGQSAVVVGNGIIMAGKETDITWVSNITFTNNEIRNVGKTVTDRISTIDFNGPRNHPTYNVNYGYWSSAMMVKDSTNILIANNYIHHNGVTDFDHGIYQYSQSTIMENNIIYNNSGTCIKGGWESGAGTKSIIRNNLCYNNGLAQFVKGANGSVAGRKPRGLSSHFSVDYEYYNNIIFGKYSSGGIDIIYGPQRTRVYNNFVYNTGGAGIIIGGGGAITPQVWDVGGTLVRNNIAYSTDGVHSAIEIGGRSKDTIAENNLVWGNKAQVAVSSLSQNTISRNNTAADPRFVAWPTAYLAPDKQINSIAEADALRAAVVAGLKLQSSSPGINKGITVAEVKSDFINVSRPQGGAYDIGPFEFGGTPTTPVVTTPVPTTPTPITNPTVGPTSTVRPTSTPVSTGTATKSPTPTTSTNLIKGDANRDGDVNTEDYTIWQREFINKNGTSADFNKDNKVNGVDYALWFNSYGK